MGFAMFPQCCACKAMEADSQINVLPFDQRANGARPQARGSHVDNEKERLRELIENFAKQAVKGCPCTIVNDGKRISAQYHLDQSLQQLTIAPSSGSAIVCQLTAIQDIYSVAEDGEACLPPKLLSKLYPHEKELLIM